MITALANETKFTISDNPIQLDDYSNGCNALYSLSNHSGEEYVYFSPDEYRPSDPACDYVLTKVGKTRFIELKGGNHERRQCCRTEWGHAFHQLFSSFSKYQSLLEQEEVIVFVLCTSIENGRRAAARYSQYRWYKMLQQTGHSVIVLSRGEIDT